jgi:alpha-tubulin suppressor-like RCC1 family protein
MACVGANGNGQLGNGTSGQIPSPDWLFVRNITDAVEVQCGEVSTCVLRLRGKASCWGYGIAIGAPDTRSTENRLSPYETLSGGAVKIAAGDQHVCAIMERGVVKCWCAGGAGPLPCARAGGGTAAARAGGGV